MVDDNSAWRRALVRRLADEGFATETAATLLEARAALTAAHYDLVLVDMRLPDGDGLDLVDTLEKSPDTVVVLMTGHASVDSAVQAFRHGVTDYLTKPIDLGRLAEILAEVRRTLASRHRRGRIRSGCEARIGSGGWWAHPRKCRRSTT